MPHSGRPIASGIAWTVWPRLTAAQAETRNTAISGSAASRRTTAPGTTPWIRCDVDATCPDYPLEKYNSFPETHSDTVPRPAYYAGMTNTKIRCHFRKKRNARELRISRGAWAMRSRHGCPTC